MQVIRIGQQAMIFTLEEATRIRDLFQNPLYEDETSEEAEFREKMFTNFKEYVKNTRAEESSFQKAQRAPVPAHPLPIDTPYVPPNWDDDIPF
jgi:hypothetical protein